MSTRSAPLAVGSLFLCCASAVFADQAGSAPAHLPGDHIGFETGALLPPQTLSFSIGTSEGEQGLALGTGRQNYGGEFRWRGAAPVEFGFAVQVYDDPPAMPIGGSGANITALSFGPSVKYQYLSEGALSLAVQGAVEVMVFGAEFLDSSDGSAREFPIGSLQFPASYQVQDHLQLHANAGLAAFPDSLNGNSFYGTFYHGGAGFTWTPARNLQVYGAAQGVFGPGGNGFASDGAIRQSTVWALGARYAVSPYASADLYATTGIGFTPATALLADLPSRDAPLYGFRFNYLPTLGPARMSRADTRATTQDAQLQVDGFGVGSAHTLSPRTFQTTVTLGTDGNRAAHIAAARDPGVQFDAVIEEFADDASVDPAAVPAFEPRLSFGGRLRLLSAKDGAPFTVTARLLAGRDLEAPTVGVFYGGLPITYQPSGRLALHVDPRFAAFGDQRTAGVGVGVSYRMTDALQMLAEVTATDRAQPAIWSIGARYDLDGLPVSIDAFATNAIGRHGLGTLIAQDDPRFGIGLTWRN